MNITLIQIEYILALDTYRHFANAAEACHVTQPTLSMQIQKLEDSLGVKIFDRSKQPVVPTDIGKKIIAQARIALTESKRIEELIEDEKSEVRGELHIGIIPTVAPYLLPLFIGKFMNTYPNIKLVVKEMLTEEIIKAIDYERIDIGIAATPLRSTELTTIPLFYEEFFAYLSSNSPLLQKESLDSNSILDEQLWLLNEGHCFREQVIRICQNAKESNNLNFQYQSGSLGSLKNMVDRQGGATLLPELAALEIKGGLKNNLRPFDTPAPLREISLVMKRSYLKKRLVEVVKNQIQESLPTSIRLKDANRGEIIKW